MKSQKIKNAALVFAFQAIVTQAFAQANVDLSRAPLFVRPQVPANIVLTFDDSGSMNEGITPNELRGGGLRVGVPGCYWQSPHIYAAVANNQYYDPSQVYVTPVYANGNNYPNAVFTAAYLDGFEAHRTGTEVTTKPKKNLATNYAFSVYSEEDTNLIRFTNGASSTNCGQLNGRIRNSGADVDERFFTYPDPVANAARTEFRAFYYVFNDPTPATPPTKAEVYETGSSTNYTFRAVTTAEETNFANWYSYYRTRTLMGRTASLRAFSQLPKEVRIAWQGLNGTVLNNNFNIRKIDNTAHRESFFGYLNSVNTSGGTPTRAATSRVASYFGDANADANETNPYYDNTLALEVSCRQNYHMVFTDGGWKDNVGSYNGQNWDQPTTPFALPTTYVAAPATAPAPFTFPTDPHTKVYTNGPAQNNIGGYADLAFRFWSTDLRPLLRNNVAPFLDDRTTGITGPVVNPLPADPFSNAEVYWNPKNDPATWQHLVQFIVAFGLTSSLDFPGDLTNLRKGDKLWTRWDNVENGDPKEKVDDTWHAALNSRGELLAASNPQELVAQMNAVFQAISNRTANIAQASVSSGLLTTSVLGFRTFFNASAWSGTVRAVKFGATETVQWDAGCLLTGGTCSAINGSPSFSPRDPATRKIYTLAGTNPVDFQWANLTAQQKNQLDFNFDSNADDDQGEKRVAFLRGDRSQEGGLFRSRESVLGAIVSSSAVFVGGANDEYWTQFQEADVPLIFPANATTAGPETKTNFRAHFDAMKTRGKTVYVGANDGMLHAFDAETGAERWAYVPRALYRQLSRYTSRSSLFFQPGVDASPMVREAFVGGAWKTMLVSTLRGGGQGVFALDITNPNPSVAPSQRVMWEFTDDSVDGADLGYTYGQPFITRAKNGKWVVLVPGGYNAGDSRDPVTGATGYDTNVGSGRAVLFVLDAQTGSVIRKFDLGAGTSGLGSVTAGDYVIEPGPVTGPVKFVPVESGNPLNRSFDQVTDVAFAGDNAGNVWRFDMRSTNPGSWVFRKLAVLPTGQVLTAAPRLAAADGYAVVGFGTGRFVTQSDRATTTQQAVYGIYDTGPSATAVLATTNLQAQTLSVTGTGASRQIRTTGTTVAAGKYGWYFNLPSNSGERVLNQAAYLVSLQAYILPSFTPTADPTAANDPCRDESLSTFYFINAGTGGPASLNGVASFDVNNDGRINSADDATISGFSVNGFIGGATAVLNAGGGGSLVLGDGQARPPGGSGPGGGGPGGAPPCGSSCIQINGIQWRRGGYRELPAWDPNERN